MRLGGPVFIDPITPESWIRALNQNGYRAAYCPVQAGASREEIQAYAKAARDADIIIAEVGAWSNIIDPDPAARRQAIEYNKQQLALADEIGARCCVDFCGTRGNNVMGPDPMDMTPETFEMIVASVRDIIDAVKPRRAYYTIEPMPWAYPDSPDSYNDLIQAIDRPRLGVHLDLVNMINTPRLYFQNTAFIHECFTKLGSKIISAHVKDTLLSNTFTVHLKEVRPGLGFLDYRTFFREMARLPVDTPMLLEHLPLEEDYLMAARYLREVGKELDIAL